MHDQYHRTHCSHTQNFQCFVIANCNPVWLCRSPLYLIDLPFCRSVCQDGVLNGPWHLLNVPDKRLMVITWKLFKWILLAHCSVDVTLISTHVYRKKEPSVCERCINLPAVQMWQEECGAHAMPLTQARWLFNRATGVQGTLTSSIITCNRETCQYVNGMVETDYNVTCCFMQA